MKKKLFIGIELDLTPIGLIAIEKDRSNFQRFAEDMAAHFSKERRIVQGTRVTVEIRNR